MIKQEISGIIPHSGSQWTIVCDFDGTISFADVTDTLMENFGHPDWQLLEHRWELGEIGSRECLSGQVSLMDVSPQQLNACIDGITIDSEFASFVQWAQEQSIPLIIVSDGLDYAIERILNNNHIYGLPIIANHLQQIGERRWTVTFPHNNPDCLKASGTCKCQVARQQAPQAFVMIGDGRSDFCVASIADHVLAKKSLLAECQKSAIPHTPFDNFSEARVCVERLLARDYLNSVPEAP